MRSPNDSLSSKSFLFLQHFGCTKINKKSFPLEIHNAILRFYISVHDVKGMQIFNCQQNGPKIIP